MAGPLLGRIGSHPAAVWMIKHVVSPLDRMFIRVGRGRVRPPSSLVVPSLLLTVRGRKTGTPRTVPLVFVRGEAGYIVANARPAGERPNPWVSNLEAAGQATISVHGTTIAVAARRLRDDECDGWWPLLVDAWPAFAHHYAATGDRAVFVLDPVNSSPT